MSTESPAPADVSEVEAEAATTWYSRWLARSLRGFGGLALALFTVGLAGELFVMLANVVTRTWFDKPIQWIFEAAQLAMLLMVFFGGAYAYGADRHVRLDLLHRRLSTPHREQLEIVADTYIVLAAVATFWISLGSVSSDVGQATPVLRIPLPFFDAVMSVGVALIGLIALLRVLSHGRAILGWGVVAAAVWVGVLVACQQTLGGTVAEPGRAVGWLTFALFVVSLIAGIPIAFVLLVSGFFYLALSGAAPAQGIVSAMMDSTANYTNLTIPFFVFAGILLTAGGLSLRITEFVRSVIGRLRGGLLHVVVISMYLFSGLSGSKVADVAAVGSALKDGLAAEGRRPQEGAAALAASAVMGEAVPPSLVMLLLGSVTTLPISGLFLAGIVPAIVVGLAIMVLIFIREGQRRPAATYTGRDRIKLLGRALPAFAVPVVLLGGIVWGIASTTEISAVAVLVALVLMAVLQRSFRGFAKSLSETGAIGGMVLLIVTAASGFSYALSVGGLPNTVASLFTDLHNSKVVIVLATLVILPVLGMILEGAPAVLILAPIVVPIAIHAGIPQLQYGILFVLVMGLGAYAPPIGVGINAVCAVTGSTLGAVSRKILPFWAIIVAAVILIAAVPELSLWLPNWLLGSSSG